MRYRILATLALIALASVGADGQIKRNGVWQGSDVQRGNPHNLAPQVLHREPAACGVTPWQQPRGVYNDPSWENNIIPFVFSNNTDLTMKEAMWEAMDEVIRRTGVMFVERSDEPDYLFIQDADGNSSFVGRIGGPQDVNIFNWNFEFIMVHELMHAIGIWHEQSASDRDNFVTVHYDYIQPGREHNFDIRPDANLTEFYDYDSVMHYGQYAFSILPDILPTIETTDPGWQDEIGQRERLSNLDVVTLQDMHGGPVPTQWISTFNSSIVPIGTFLDPQTSIEFAVAFVPDGGRIAVYREHINAISEPLTINKHVLINGAPITIGGN